MSSRLPRGEAVLIVGLVLALAAGPLVLRGDRTETRRLEANADAIRGLSQAERTRLDRNYQRFRQMSGAEQEAWREFAADVAGSDARTQVLDTYYEWLQGVPGYRREELRQTTNLDQRVELVKATADDQVAARIGPGNVQGLGGRIPLLGQNDLALVMEQFERKLNGAERDKLVDKDGNSLEGFERHVMVLELLRARYKQPGVFLEPAFTKLVFDRLPPRVMQHLHTERGPQVQLFFPMLRLALQQELEREREASRPDESALKRFFEQELSPAEQDELFGVSASEFHDRLQRRYLEAHVKDRLAIDPREALRFLSVEMPRQPFDGRPGDGFGGPGRGLRPGQQRDGEGPRGGPPFGPQGDRDQTGPGFRGGPNRRPGEGPPNFGGGGQGPEPRGPGNRGGFDRPPQKEGLGPRDGDSPPPDRPDPPEDRPPRDRPAPDAAPSPMPPR